MNEWGVVRVKTIGLIGGMSWESTAVYYRIINEEVKAQLGGLHSAQCVLYSVDFAEIQRYQAEGNWDKAGQYLGEVAYSLEQAVADFIVICTNTMHKVIEAMEARVRIPILHIADATAKQIQKANIRTVGLLGTKYTMEQSFYKSRLESSGLSVIIPNEAERDIVNHIIFKELCLGDIRPASREAYQGVIKSLIAQGAEAIILGCTEIGLLIGDDDAEVPLFDTTVIHAIEAVDHAFE